MITFYALAFPQAKIGFLWRYFYYFRWIRLPAWFVFVLWIFFQIIGAYEQKIGISSVSSFAHLGGAGVGLGCVVSYAKNRASRCVGTQGSSPVWGSLDGSSSRASPARTSCQYNSAFGA